MKNESLVKAWLEFADMDADLADFTFDNMHPKPLELICYHCQQAAEKALKALFVFEFETDVPKTHDLALLVENLSERFSVDDILYNICSDLTPYGVKIRYPKEIIVDEEMTKKALFDKKRILDWVKTQISP